MLCVGEPKKRGHFVPTHFNFLVRKEMIKLCHVVSCISHWRGEFVLKGH